MAILRRVVVLGAGTSKCAGAPITSEFRSALESILGANPPILGLDALARLAISYDDWKLRHPDLDVEQYYILNDLRAKLFGDSRQALLELRYLIAKTLQVSTSNYDGVIHEKLVRTLIQGHGDHETTIISLNWDAEIDMAGLAVAPTLIDYGFAVNSSWSPAEGRPHSGRRFAILKPHGSIGWVSCAAGHVHSALERNSESRPVRKDAIHLWEPSGQSSANCPKCDGAVDPLFIPPLSEKLGTATAEPIKAVWKRAHEALKECTEIVFAGYSFPPADLQFRLLVKDALRENDNLRLIDVVTAPVYGSVRSQFEDRYTANLLPLKSRVALHFLYETFERWVNRNYSGPELHELRRLPKISTAG